MDNYIDNLGEPDGSQSQPEDTPPLIEPQEVSGESSSKEAQEQADMPDFPERPDKDEKMWGTFCHLAFFAGYIGVPFGQILGPLIIWLIKKEESPFINENGRKALNFQISIAVYMLASTPLICGGPLILLAVVPLMILDIIFPIKAAIKANKGEEVSYPISIEFIK